ncbi:AAA family ATPase [bacterium]|nr:AAA family ATPase [bacterium]
MANCDEVFAPALTEFERIAYRKSTIGEYFCRDLGPQGACSVVLTACLDLRRDGLKPSDDEFAFQLKERVLSIAHKCDSGCDVTDEHYDVNCLLSRILEKRRLKPEHGLKLLQKMLRAYADRVYIISRRHDIAQATERLQARLLEIEALTAPHCELAAERFQNVLENIERHRGKELHGLKTGLVNLDERTAGLHGLTMVCAPPGQGKTVLATEIALGVLRHRKDNDCAVLMLSLEMTEEEMTARMLSRLSRVPESVVYMGDDPEREGALTADTRKSLNNGIKQYKRLGKRLMLVDGRESRLQPPTETHILSLVSLLQKRTKASQVLIVVDYLQLLDVGGMDGLQADRHQFQQLQNVSRQGYTVLAISESRKPASSKDLWATSLADIKGDGRLGYGASGVFLLRPMTGAEVARCYKKPSAWLKKGGSAGPKLTTFIETLDSNGKAPLCLFIDKMRAPGRKGSVFFEFDYLRNRMKPLLPGSVSGLPEDVEELENATLNPGLEV